MLGVDFPLETHFQGLLETWSLLNQAARLKVEDVEKRPQHRQRLQMDLQPHLDPRFALIHLFLSTENPLSLVNIKINSL